MKYQVLVTSSTTKLSEMVEEAAKEGWVPQGGVSVCGFPIRGVMGGRTTRTEYAQAMIHPILPNVPKPPAPANTGGRS